MNNFARAHNSYLEPPDEPEAVLCDDCGEEMEVKQDMTGDYYAVCNNKFCPDKFTGDAREMAELLIGATELLIGATEEVKSLARKIKRLENARPEWTAEEILEREG